MESLFISDSDKYYGFLAKRPLIPGGQVWVFQQYDGESYILRGLEDDPLPPRPPMLERHSTTIYKFRRSASFPWKLTLFAGSGLPIDIETNVTLFLRDPVAFINSGQCKTDNSMAIETALYKALRGPLGEELRGTSMQVVSPDIRDIAPPALSQLLPETDLSRFVQGVSSFRQLGLEVRVVVRETHMPEAYKKLMHEATLAIQEQLLQVKRNMIEAVANLEIERLQAGVRLDIARRDLAFKEELYRSQVGYIEHVLPRVQPIIEEIIRQTGAVAQQSLQPTLAATIFNDIIRQTIEQVLQGSTGGASQLSGAPSGVSFSSAINQRDAEVQALYQMAQVSGWTLLPPQNKFRDEITFALPDNCKLRLLVPKLYPKVLPVVTDVKQQGSRLPQNQVNTITKAVTTGKFDLSMLVQAVADAIAIV